MKPVLDGVYFLIKSGEVVYVGQSSDIYRRISEHRTGTPKHKGPPKDFDRWEFIEVASQSDKDAIEYLLIHLIHPVLNKDYRARGKAASIENMMARIDKDLKEKTDQAMSFTRLFNRMKDGKPLWSTRSEIQNAYDCLLQLLEHNIDEDVDPCLTTPT